MASQLVNIPIDGQSSNTLGLVQAVKQCSGCSRLIWWCHFPGSPGDDAPAFDMCWVCRG